jgi:cardiolipin synthase
MDMGVGNLISGHDDSDSLTAVHDMLGASDGLSHGEQVGVELCVGIDPVVDLQDRHHQRVSIGHRVDRHERRTVGVAPDEVARKFPVDDAGEDGAHTSRFAHRWYDAPYASLMIDSDPAAGETRDAGLWTVPNLFTLLRLAALPAFVYLLFVSQDRVGAALTLGALSATDWVDGFLARRLDQRSEFGAKFDPTVDRLVFIVAVLAILIDGSMPIWFGTAILVREVAVGGTVAIATVLFSMRRFDVTFLGKTATMLLMFAVPAFLLGASELSSAGVFGALAWMLGIPGLVLSYVTALGYLPKIRAGLESAS